MYKTKKRKMFRTKQSAVSISSQHWWRNLCNRLFKIEFPRHFNADDVVRQAVPDFNSAIHKTSSWRIRSWFRPFQGMACHTQACAGCSYWAVGSRKHGFQIRRAQTDMHPIQDCRSCNLPPLIKRRNEYLRFPFKVKVDYFILHSILVSSFVMFPLFFAMNKGRRTYEASGCWISTVCKEVLKHPHSLPIFKVVSEHLSFPLKLKVHHLIFYPGLRFHLRNFSTVFCYEEKKMHVRSREQKWKTDNNMLSVLKNRPDIAYQYQLL